jgi:hypothetical protein
MKSIFTHIFISLFFLPLFFFMPLFSPPFFAPFSIAHAATINKSVSTTTGGLTNTDLTSASSTSGLVGYWPFDGKYMTWTSATAGTAADASGNNNTGTLTSMSRATSTVEGKIGQALKFNGTSQYINIPHVANDILDKLTAPMTISFWVKINNNSNYNGLVSKTASEYEVGADFRTGGTALTWRSQAYTLGSTWPSYFSGYTGQWVFVTTVVSGTNVTGYRNGISQGSVSVGTIATGTDDVDIGTRPSNAFYVSGSLDDLRIYNRALSAQEVKQLYNSGLATINKSTTGLTNTDLTSASSTALGNPSGLVGYWPFDGKYMTWSSATVGTSTDASGNGNNGTLVNMNIATSTVEGKIGQALSFNGVSTNNCGINLGRPSVLNITGNFTVSAWIKPSVSGTNGAIFTIGRTNAGASTRSQIYLFGASGQPILGIMLSGPTQKTVQASTSVSANTWYLVTGVYNGSTISIYMNGLFQQSTVASGALQSNGPSDPDSIGYDAGGSNSYYKGSIDDVRLYNRALSATEVQQLYDMGR